MKLSDTLKSIRKTTGAELLEDSPLAEVKDWLTSGSYALNRVMTGDINKGFPVGRISTLYGASQSGKSLLAAMTVVNAVKNNLVDIVYIFDSEGGVLVDTYRRSGCDMSKIQYIPVASVEDCGVKMMKVYDTLVQAREEYLKDPANNDNIRTLCILDSFGALKSEKLVTDALNKNQMVQDMGLTAKLKNNMINVLMMKVVQSNATLIVTNHEYSDPAQMYASKIHNMGGGKGIEFASHIIVQCEKLLVKSGDNEFLTGLESDTDHTGYFKGNKMKFMPIKNRTCKPCFQATVYIDFNSGISKYDGLIEDAVKYGFLEEVRGGYICPSYSEKRVTYKDLVSKDEIWNTFIDDFNARSKELMEYSNSTSRELDRLEAELENEGGSEDGK